jgi:hypothetical protein
MSGRSLMGVVSGAGAVVVLAVAVILVGLVAVVGLAVGLHRRDVRRRTFSADAWAAAGYGIPQAAVDRALAAAGEPADPYPSETPTATKSTAKKTAANKTAVKKTAAERATSARKR